MPVRFRAVLYCFCVFLLLSFAACSRKAESPRASGSAVSGAVMSAPVEADGIAAEKSAVAEGARVRRDASADEASSGGNRIQPRPGLLTAGEWNDNAEYDFLLKLMQTNQEWRSFEQRWQMSLARRAEVKAAAGNEPAVNAVVELLSKNGENLWTARTDNSGTAYVFAGFNKSRDAAEPATLRVTYNGSRVEKPYAAGQAYHIAFSGGKASAPALDLMFVVDTTGSMQDELDFLNAELVNVIDRVRRDNANIPVRLSVNVYRDEGDEYVIRAAPFDRDLKNAQNFLSRQKADGGGDYEEAVEQALDDALNKHDWDMDARARLLFLVLDAPPHNTKAVAAEMRKLTAQAASMGIRIIPVASSGVDKDTEFLLRALAAASGGTYVFLTDDSGIGYAHLEPTIGPYDVEQLNNLLARLINGYLR